jgi:SNF2 family DNA or RNA helicase
VESRAHRIEQTNDVKLFRWLSRKTVEEYIFERAKQKRVLNHLVFFHGVEGDELDKDGKNKFTNKNLRQFCDLDLRNSSKKLVLLPTMVW